MKGTIDFRYDSINDIVIATPHWHIETEADVLEWYEQFATYMARFTRKMDFIVIVDGLVLKSSIGPLWGEYRAKLHQKFGRFNYRVHASQKVKFFVNTSGVRYNVSTQEAATVEDAIEGIQRARLEANIR